MFIINLIKNTFRYSLFKSFNKRIKNIKHIKEQEPAIKKYYRKQLSFKFLSYAKFWAIIAAIFLLIYTIYKSTDTFLEKRVVTSYKITQDANLRNSPSTNSKIIKVLKAGERINGDDIGEWIEITSGDEKNYVSKSLVEPFNNGGIVITKILHFISALIVKFISNFPEFYKMLLEKYNNSAFWQIIIVTILIIIVMKIYSKLASDKAFCMEKTIDQICTVCGTFGYVKISKTLVNSETEQETRVSYETQNETTRNTRGETVLTTTKEVPITRIINVHYDTYKILYSCKKCGQSAYKFRTESWES